MDELPNFPQAFCVLFGLIYTLHLDYPKRQCRLGGKYTSRGRTYFNRLRCVLRMTNRKAMLLLLAVGTALAKGIGALLLREPTIRYCVFLEHANVTCYWEPAANMSFKICYTLTVNTTVKVGSVWKLGHWVKQCITTHTHCSAPILSLKHNYSMDVQASLQGSHIRSATHYRHGLLEAKLYPPHFTKLLGIAEKPECLKLFWDKPKSFGLSRQEVENKSILLFQIELHSPEQPHVRVREKNVSAFYMLACNLVPGITYTARMRYRIVFGNGPWSDWSKSLTNTTTEAGFPMPNSMGSPYPLLWGPIPNSMGKPLLPGQANGKVLQYMVGCRGQEGVDGVCGLGQCGGALPAPRLSCQLPVPPHACSCSIWAANSAGTSPPAHITIPSATAVPGMLRPPLSSVWLTVLGDRQLLVRWVPGGGGGGVKGFVLQWSSVSPPTLASLHWDRVNASVREYIITEGVEPEMPCYVSVRALYGDNEPGPELFRKAFTRQGVPSAGPSVMLQELGEDSVTLRWGQPPLAQLRGFLLGYTIFYTNSSGHSHRKPLGNRTEVTLRGLKGKYNMCLEASTVGGSTVGPCITVLMAGGSVGVSTIFQWGSAFPIMVLFGLLVAFILRARIQRSLCLSIPDASRSSVSSSWPPPHLLQVAGRASGSAPSFILSGFLLFTEGRQQSDLTSVSGSGRTVGRRSPASVLSWTTPLWSLITRGVKLYRSVMSEAHPNACE
ncbi:hypothetical protein ACEWY4_006053 [Coilia grayii]|uniref:Fibronectin type-III domain-containing protein n=1 Tax=Coilia grayii TaxID=363190 RepID=A0ABD1KCQ9_9TELE